MLTRLACVVGLLSLSFVLCRGEDPPPRPPTYVQNVNHSGWAHDFCGAAGRWSSGAVPLDEGLNGETITVAFFDDHHATENGSYVPGFHYMVLDAVAKRAGFSFEIMQQVAIPDESHTDLLERTVLQADLAAGVWTSLPKRRMKGINTIFALQDMSYRLVTIQSFQEPTQIEQLLEFAAPFHLEVWILTVFGCVFTAAVYWFFERSVNSDDLDQPNIPRNLERSMFLSTALATGGGGFAPKTTPGRVMVVSWTLVLLILMNSYTANLASFLVATPNPITPVSAFSDAKAQKVSMCLKDQDAEWDEMAKLYPDMVPSFVGATNSSDKLDKLTNGDCVVALFAASDWDDAQGLPENANCNFVTVGDPIKSLYAGWAYAMESLNGGPSCAEFMADVVSLHLGEMDQEGEISRLWQRFLAEDSQVNCQAQGGGGGGGGNDPLDLSNVGGAFVFHLILSGIAVLAHVIGTCAVLKEPALPEIEEANSGGKAPGDIEMARAKAQSPDTMLADLQAQVDRLSDMATAQSATMSDFLKLLENKYVNKANVKIRLQPKKKEGAKGPLPPIASPPPATSK